MQSARESLLRFTVMRSEIRDGLKVLDRAGSIVLCVEQADEGLVRLQIARCACHRAAPGADRVADFTYGFERPGEPLPTLRLFGGRRGNVPQVRDGVEGAAEPDQQVGEPNIGLEVPNCVFARASPGVDSAFGVSMRLQEAS